MKRALLLLVALLGLLVTAPAVHAQPPASPFSGHWEAIDPLDGSNLEVVIRGTNTAQMIYTDHGAPFTCGDPANQVFTGFLTASIDGDVLGSTFRWAHCGSGNLHFEGFELTWTLGDMGTSDLSDDVLTNDFGEEFTPSCLNRVAGMAVPPRRPNWRSRERSGSVVAQVVRRSGTRAGAFANRRLRPSPGGNDAVGRRATRGEKAPRRPAEPFLTPWRRARADPPERSAAGARSVHRTAPAPASVPGGASSPSPA
jgi:hypothetical protein